MDSLKKRTQIAFLVAGVSLMTACADSSSSVLQTQGEGIVNGFDVTYEDPFYRKVLSLKTTFEVTDEEGNTKNKSTQCSASAISSRLILTAAHCVYANTVFQRIEYVTPEKKHEIKIIDAIPHSEFPAVKAYDIAVLLTEEDLPEEIEILSLPLENDHLPEMIEAAGYGRSDGRLNAETPGSGKLRRKALRVQSNSETLPIFTVEQKEGGACQGDSGSPGMARRRGQVVVFGVAARTISAKSEAPDRDLCRDRAEYTRVTDLLDFIKDSSNELLSRNQ